MRTTKRFGRILGLGTPSLLLALLFGPEVAFRVLVKGGDGMGPDGPQRHETPPRVAIVLGVGPGPLLEGRLDAACALVERGLVDRLVLSGMPHEAPRMRDRARECLPASAIEVDDGATRTLENLRRARDRFGVRSAYVVTQPFHLPRALFLGRALGLDVRGVAATGQASFYTTSVRERLAGVEALVDAARLVMAR
jgi:SanA protein